MSTEYLPIFVCYSHLDEPIVAPIIRVMRVGGALTFRDTESIKPAQPWRDVIVDALESAVTIMVFWSRHAAVSAVVQAEWLRGKQLEKAILPTLLDSTPLPVELAEYQWIDLRSLAAIHNLEADGQPPRETLRSALNANAVFDAVSLIVAYFESTAS